MFVFENARLLEQDDVLCSLRIIRPESPTHEHLFVKIIAYLEEGIFLRGCATISHLWFPLVFFDQPRPSGLHAPSCFNSLNEPASAEFGISFTTACAAAFLVSPGVGVLFYFYF